MHQSWLDLDPDYINLHNMQIAFHFSAHFNLIDSDNYQQGHDFFCYTHEEAVKYEEKPC